MPFRKVPLAAGEIYHVFTKSIAGFKIFNSCEEYERMIKTMVFYSAEKRPCKFSMFNDERHGIRGSQYPHGFDDRKIVKIIAYCLMPTHVHLVLEQIGSEGISIFINLVLKSYSKYFNLKHNRKGPLWEGRFKNVIVEDDNQLLHLTRYVHLNPVTSYLVEKPEEWAYSSYNEYISTGINTGRRICEHREAVDLGPADYKKFANDGVSYQRELARLKSATYSNATYSKPALEEVC
jgi:putative transposase